MSASAAYRREVALTDELIGLNTQMAEIESQAYAAAVAEVREEIVPFLNDSVFDNRVEQQYELYPEDVRAHYADQLSETEYPRLANRKAQIQRELKQLGYGQQAMF